MVHGLDVLSVYDPATGEVVQLNTLGDGSEVQAAHPLDGDGGVKTPTGSPYYGGDHSRLSVVFVDEGAYETLALWQRQGRLLSFAGAGPAGALLWYERDLIRVRPETVKGASGGARGWILEAERRGHGAHRIWLNEGVLAGIVGPLATPSGLGTGWQVSGMDVAAVDPASGSVRLHDNNTQSVRSLSVAPVVFPVSGVTLTMSTGQTGATGAHGMELICGGFGGGFLSGVYPSPAGTQHPARVAGSIVTPPGIWQIRINMLIAQSAFGGADVTIYRPALRLGTSTAPGALAP